MLPRASLKTLDHGTRHWMALENSIDRICWKNRRRQNFRRLTRMLPEAWEN